MSAAKSSAAFMSGDALHLLLKSEQAPSTNLPECGQDHFYPESQRVMGG